MTFWLSNRLLKQLPVLTRPTRRLLHPPALSLPRQPLCPGTRLIPSKAAASEGPQAYPLGYVEGLNDARTMLAGFFSILLERLDH